MSNALIVFGTTTGNTESVAEQIAQGLMDKGVEVTSKNVINARIEELGNGFDLTVLGSSTWGEDEIEFQEDFEPFFVELAKANLKGKKVALFGCGDSSYEYFCGAVDELESMMQKLGAEVVQDSLRIDGDPSDSSDEIEVWAAAVASKV